MLTVLFRYQRSRVEVLKMADSVEYTPPHGKSDDPANPPKNVEPGLLLTLGEKGEHVELTGVDDPDYRDVFVMNDNGATVARYTL